jgi:hypothetical protein
MDDTKKPDSDVFVSLRVIRCYSADADRPTPLAAVHVTAEQFLALMRAWSRRTADGEWIH